jgi:hypothetical protein
MRRAMVYVVLLGTLTGLVAGTAAFGLPLPGEVMGAAPRALTAALLDRGIALSDAATAVGGAALTLLALVALVDLRRVARAR